MHGITSGLLALTAVTSAAYAVEAWRRASLVDALRAWWVDPAVATLSFNFAIDVFDRRERALGHTEEGRMSTFVPGPGFVAPGSVFMLSVAGFLYWVGILFWVNAVRPPKDIPDGWPADLTGATYLLLEVCGGVWAYDLIFSFIHWGLHSWEVRAHDYHHTKKVDMRARDVLTHSPVDGALQVLVNIAVQRHTPWGSAKSRLARAAHNVIVTWMLTESHTASPTPRIARRFFVGVRRHRAHHVGAQYFQQFFGYLDDLRLATNGRRSAKRMNLPSTGVPLNGAPSKEVQSAGVPSKGGA